MEESNFLSRQARPSKHQFYPLNYGGSYVPPGGIEPPSGVCEPGEARTRDILLKREALYQLSYRSNQELEAILPFYSKEENR